MARYMTRPPTDFITGDDGKLYAYDFEARRMALVEIRPIEDKEIPEDVLTAMRERGGCNVTKRV